LFAWDLTTKLSHIFVLYIYVNQGETFTFELAYLQNISEILD